MPKPNKWDEKWVPKKEPKQPQVVRPILYWGRLSAVLGLLGIFSALLGIISALSSLLGLGIYIPGALLVSILGIVWGIIGSIMGVKQNPRTLASNIGIVFSILAIIGSVLAASAAVVAPPVPINNGNGNSPGTDIFGDGHCYSNSDCSGFGSRHCSGAVCGSDKLCHCPFETCKGSSCSVLTCSKGCPPNSHCEGSKCVHNQGGLTTD